MPKLSEIPPNGNRTWLFIGDSGTGKTTAATSFPATSEKPIHVCDFDDKVTSAASFYRGTPQFDCISYERYVQRSDWKRFAADMNALSKVPKDQFPYSAIVLDSVTTFATMLMNEVMTQVKSEKRTVVTSVTGPVSTPMLSDYNVAIHLTKDIIKNILALRDRCNVIFTAHIMRDKDESTGEITYQPLIWGKDLPLWLPVVFEEVYRTYTDVKDGKITYLAQTKSRNKFIARTQISKLPDPVKLGYSEFAKYF
jgi:hypothetical protein